MIRIEALILMLVIAISTKKAARKGDQDELDRVELASVAGSVEQCDVTVMQSAFGIFAYKDCGLGLKDDIAAVFKAVLPLAGRQDALHRDFVHRTFALGRGICAT
ncbi:hypothetical protein [Salipiger bermudensis]|uniref:hypothetical protein n=1 Tax=Salipiger bermudensis TaxID=344736 RepID=UPI001CD1B741|nr:hypothetical protein [Salipiger bermudensis]MCA0963361.1 hypothetical protein [Salipiger bermudensis]